MGRFISPQIFQIIISDVNPTIRHLMTEVTDKTSLNKPRTGRRITVNIRLTTTAGETLSTAFADPAHCSSFPPESDESMPEAIINHSRTSVK